MTQQIHLGRTRLWAERFRLEAAKMPADPPENIDPLLWVAQREALESQAEDLEAQIREFNDDH